VRGQTTAERVPFRAFGLGSTEALAYALIRRARELVYALVGLAFLWRQEASFRQLKARVSSEMGRVSPENSTVRGP
jgi:hypothetical protein